MDYKAIQELIKTMSESELTSLEIESEGIAIKMKKEAQLIALERNQETAQTIIPEQKVVTEIKKENAESEQKDIQPKVEKGTLITAPIVGTVYLSPSPEAGAFVKVGDKINKGDTLCIIEAMKLMNEIESEAQGEILEILVENEQMVEYGQPLFRIKE